jgi:hypothetical protein
MSFERRWFSEAVTCFPQQNSLSILDTTLLLCSSDHAFVHTHHPLPALHRALVPPKDIYFKDGNCSVCQNARKLSTFYAVNFQYTFLSSVSVCVQIRMFHDLEAGPGECKLYSSGLCLSPDTKLPVMEQLFGPKPGM